jgi:transposase
MRTSKRLLMNNTDRVTLERMERNGNTPPKTALRARITLMSADGITTTEIMRQLGTSTPTITRWRKRYETAGIPGLLKDRSRPGRKKRIEEDRVREVVEKTLQEKPLQATHWSTRSLAAAVGLSPATVQRIWKEHGLKPHLVRSFKLSRDPHFIEKLHARGDERPPSHQEGRRRV